MRNLTSPQAILLGLIAFAIASIPYSSKVIKPAHAANVQKVVLCDPKRIDWCATVNRYGKLTVIAEEY